MKSDAPISADGPMQSEPQVRCIGIVGLRDQWPPNMTMRGWMRWQENRWKMHDRQVAWIREQKAYAAQSNAKLRDAGESGVEKH